MIKQIALLLALALVSGLNATAAQFRVISVSVSAPGLGRSPSGALVAPALPNLPPVADDSTLVGLYSAARPNSDAAMVLSKNYSFARAAAQIFMHYTFHGEDFIAESADQVPPGAAGRQLLRAVKDMAAVADSTDPAARTFMDELGRNEARHLIETKEQREVGMRLNAMFFGVEPRMRLPRNVSGAGHYWDMASGLHADRFILDELEPGTHYTFFDKSPYVVSVLRHLAEFTGRTSQVTVAEKDIMKLDPPAESLAVLRNKNAGGYVPGFAKKFMTMMDWIKPGGQLFLQNDPGAPWRRAAVPRNKNLALRLLQDGWDMAFEFAMFTNAHYDLDTVTFTKPTGAQTRRSRGEAKAIWGRYVEAANFVNERERRY